MIYRAVNDSDIALDPLENGLYSKINIKVATQELFDFLLVANNIILTNDEYKKELSEFMKNSVNYNLLKINSLTNDKAMFLKNFKKHIQDYIETKNYSKLKPYLIKFFDITSTKNAHLLKGNNYATDWISFTKNLEILRYYYLNQTNKHMVVGMNSNINVIFDCDTIAYDLSSKELILENPFIYNKSKNTGLYYNTDINSQAMRYSIYDEEVIYYNYVPKDKLFVLGPLQVDMLYNGMLNNAYLNASKSAKQTIDDLLIYILESKLSDVDDLTKYVFEKIYIDAIPLKTLSEIENINYYELLNAKEKILTILNNVEITGVLGQVKQHKEKVKAIERNFI